MGSGGEQRRMREVIMPTWFWYTLPRLLCMFTAAHLMPTEQNSQGRDIPHRDLLTHSATVLCISSTGSGILYRYIHLVATVSLYMYTAGGILCQYCILHSGSGWINACINGSL